MSKNKNKNHQCCSAVNQEQINDAIRKKAAELYEKSGRKPGRDMDNWLEAERIVRENCCGITW